MNGKRHTPRKSCDTRHHGCHYRSFVGASLTELLIASLLIGFTTALIGEIVVTTTVASVKNNNQATVLGTAKVCSDRLINDIQMARAVGDFYGPGTSFPSLNNPIYSISGMQPEGGWPTTWPAHPFKLSGQCLVLQHPVIYCAKENSPKEPLYNPAALQSPKNGFPIRIKPDQISPGLPDGKAIENLDTLVYQLVPDTTRPNEYVLQMARFPGYNDPSLDTHYEAPVNPPQTVASRIIGPKQPGNSTSPPEIFRYLEYDTGYGIRQLTPAQLEDADISELIGVAIDLEFKKSEASAANGDSQSFGLHTEAYLKNNRLTLRNE